MYKLSIILYGLEVFGQSSDVQFVLPRSEIFGNFKCVLGKVKVRDDMGSQRDVFSRFCEAAPITNIAFSGGGARGIAYAGAVLALEEVMVNDHSGNRVPIRNQIESVAGSSAGAITAAFFATGLPANKFVESARQVDVSVLLDSSETKRRLVLGQSGEPFYSFIRDTIIENVCSYMRTLPQSTLFQHKRYNRLSDRHAVSITQLHSVMVGTNVCDFKEAFRPRITFAHLDALRSLEPTIFKKLSIIATDAETGLKVLFSAETTPNFEIAKACRASAAIPMVLKPVTIRVGIRDRKLIDGGYVDNIPAFEAGQHQDVIPGYNVGEEGQNLSTLVFLFDETNSKVNPFTQVGSHYWDTILKSVKGGSITRDLLPRISRTITGPTRLTVTRLSSLADVQKLYSMRNIALKVDGISTVDFKNALRLSDSLIEKAREQTKQFFDIHGETQWTLAHFDTALDLLNNLAPGKLDQLVDVLSRSEIENVFGMSMEEVINQRDSISAESGHTSCRFKFNDNTAADGEIPCISDPSFSRQVARFFPPRRKSSQNPEVIFKGQTISVKCFETPWMFGSSPLIGEYEDAYQHIATELGIMDNMDASDVFKKMKLGNGRNIKFRNFAREKAVAFCQKIDSAESFFSHRKSISSELKAYFQHIV